ncbi:hypothetical protein JM946_13515 [Steroidobacter sp. S1-65]|uniref:Uncharacterized protein n=1 Tax=Steroidobacter gossypii TaxID=2805490 RepID=A0ABS1WXQ1_9GAMM|nr:DUF5992 family protein [Steroidobacter gossypii]MBM0105754.1 hypothetical protein [Steroidobacter gossypii]
MKAMLSVFVAAICVGASTPALCGDLVIGGRVVRVANTGNNASVFSVEIAGGSPNLCANGWITFPVSASSDPEIHKRAYAAALLALTTGMPVRVHNYHSNSCDAASYIEVEAS